MQRNVGLHPADELRGPASFFHSYGISWNTVVHPKFYVDLSTPSNKYLSPVPANGNFVFLAAQNATVFRAPTPAFSTLSIRRKKPRPQPSSGSSAKSTLSTAEKIRGLRNVLKKHIKQAEHVEFVNEPEGVEVRDSLIQGAGKGLFTTKKFRKGDILCTYYGTRKSLFQVSKVRTPTTGVNLNANANVNGCAAINVTTYAVVMQTDPYSMPQFSVFFSPTLIYRCSAPTTPTIWLGVLDSIVGLMLLSIRESSPGAWSNMCVRVTVIRNRSIHLLTRRILCLYHQYQIGPTF